MNSKALARTAAVVSYIGVIAAANYATNAWGLVPIGFGLTVTAGTFFAGAALILRDAVQTLYSRIVTWAAIFAGVILSFVLSSPSLAVASAIAFAASEVTDYGVFTKLKKRSLPTAVLASSIVSAPIDTVLFLWIAGFPLTLNAIAGQFAVKTVLALIVAQAIAIKERR